MKKRFGTVILAFSLIPINCFGAVSVINEDYKTTVSTVTVTGKADMGDVIGYSVAAKNESADDVSKIKAAGDLTVDNDDGSFEIAFTMPDDTPTGDYMLRIGWFGGDEIKTKELHFINVLNTAAEIKNAVSIEKLETIFEKDSVEKEALKQLGYDFDGLNETISQNGKKAVLTAFLNDTERKNADASGAVVIFERYLGLEFINEKKESGIDKINPKFDEKNYKDIADSSLKKYLTDGIYANAPFDNIDELNSVYSELNIIYLFNNSTVGEFGSLIEKYKTDLGIENEDYYKKYSSMTSVQKNKTASLYIDYADSEKVSDLKKFKEFFQAAVKEADKKSSSESGGNRGGGGYTGGSTAVKTKPEVVDNEDNTSADNYTFSDIFDVNWAKEAIEHLAKAGIINGTAPKVFEPNSNITREQIVKMVLLCLGESAEGTECPFDDVKSEEWYAPFVAKGYKLGIINGISETEFGVGENLTRQDLAVIAVRTAKMKNVKFPSKIKESDFSDKSEISDYAKDAVDTLYSMQVISGKGGNVFAPNDYCTRAEAAKILYNTFFKQEANA